MATQIQQLTEIDPFPTRVLPQERFDETVRTNMSQVSGMVGQLNDDFIPAVNTISTEVETNANTAATKASQAASSASTAATHANTAITKASEASTSANTANTKASEAATSAQNAAANASSASDDADTATAQATAATTKASEAAESATIARTKASEAATSAATATEQATIATTKAGEAATSADTASAQAQTATTKAGEAATSATTAETHAGTATTKASEASQSASDALTYAERAEAAAEDAEAIAGIGIATTTQAGIIKPDGTLIQVAADGLMTIAPATTTNAGLVKPDGTTITIDSNGVISGTASVDVATTSRVGVVKPDGTTITVDENGTISGSTQVDIATTSQAGVVKPDGVTVQVNAITGLMSIANATTSAKGLVQLEDSTSSTSTTKAATPNSVKAAYDLANDKYTAAVATTSVAGLVKPDGSTITVDANGVISASGSAQVDVATSNTFGIVKPDNNSINVNAGIISVNSDYVVDIVGDTSLLVSERGCLLNRSANGIATTIRYKNWKGETGKMEVIDAQYRPDNKYFHQTGYSDNPDLDNFSSNNGTDWYFGQGSLSSYKTTDLPDYITNSLVYSLWGPSLAADLTAKENCDSWASIVASTDAVNVVRALTTDSANGIWDIPNEYELIILFMLADIIDSMDPTAESYPAKKIGKTHSSGRFRGTTFWSSTECSSNAVRFVSTNGYCNNVSKNYTYAVLPVRELTLNS